jgi:hypothetical protein
MDHQIQEKSLPLVQRRNSRAAQPQRGNRHRPAGRPLSKAAIYSPNSFQKATPALPSQHAPPAPFRLAPYFEARRQWDAVEQCGVRREHSEGSAMLASPYGYAVDQIEKEWCESVRNAFEAKIPKLPRFRPALRHDLLVPDDTRIGPGDRRKALAILTPWARELTQRTPMLRKMSVAVSLDVLFDIGGASRIFSYGEPKIG